MRTLLVLLAWSVCACSASKPDYRLDSYNLPLTPDAECRDATAHAGPYERRYASDVSMDSETKVVAIYRYADRYCRVWLMTSFMSRPGLHCVAGSDDPLCTLRCGDNADLLCSNSACPTSSDERCIGKAEPKWDFGLVSPENIVVEVDETTECLTCHQSCKDGICGDGF